MVCPTLQRDSCRYLAGCPATRSVWVPQATSRPREDVRQTESPCGSVTEESQMKHRSDKKRVRTVSHVTPIRHCAAVGYIDRGTTCTGSRRCTPPTSPRSTRNPGGDSSPTSTGRGHRRRLDRSACPLPQPPQRSDRRRGRSMRLARAGQRSVRDPARAGLVLLGCRGRRAAATWPPPDPAANPRSGGGTAYRIH